LLRVSGAEGFRERNVEAEFLFRRSNELRELPCIHTSELRVSAIALVFQFHGNDARLEDAQSLIVAMRARGPDGETLWHDGSVVFGHGKLVNSPECARETYPIHSNDGRFQIVWDGRLDNRDELIRELNARRVCVDQIATDPALVVAAFAEHREQTPKHLRGDFAFAIWDSVERMVFCARDPVGARPFYYALTKNFFAIASYDEALVALDGVRADLNFDRQIYALNPWFSAFEWERAWIDDVRILLPGMALSVRADGRIDKQRYSSWDTVSSRTFSDERDVVDAFADVIERAAEDRLRGLDKVAVMASGGVDSATVALASAKVRGARRIWQFSALQDEAGSCIESQGILALAQTLEAELRALYLPSLTGVCDRQDLARVLQVRHPIDDSITLVAMMCRAAQKDGQRVLLHGASGDLIMHAPNEYLWRYSRNCGFRAALREFRAANRNHTYVRGRSALSTLMRTVYTECVPPSAKLVWRKLRFDREVVLPESVPQADRAAVVREIIEREFDAQLSVERSHWRTGDAETQLGALFPVGLARGSEGYERVAGRFGIEMRDPLTDQRVIEFCLTLPLQFKTNGGWTKRLFRAYCDRVLPSVCVWRSDKIHLGGFLGDFLDERV
jgi:asparagine synthase (glutamine-hydrolysing)